MDSQPHSTDTEQTAKSSLPSFIASLIKLCRHYEIPTSVEFLTAGLPLVNCDLNPPLFIRASERAGLSTQLHSIELEHLNPDVLPVVMITRNNHACLIQKLDHQQKSASVYYPEHDSTLVVSLEQLAADYSGNCLLIKKQATFDQRTPQFLKLPEKHWFWSTLLRSKAIYRDVLLASLVINLFAIISPLFVMNVYDRVVPNNAIETLWVLAIGAAIAYLFDLLLKLARTRFIDIAGKRSDILLSAKMFEQALGQKMNQRPASVGAFARHIQEFDYIREFITSSTIATLVDLPFSLLILLVIALLAGPLAIIPLVGIVILIVHSLTIQPLLRTCITNNQQASARKNAVLIEALSGIESIKAKSAEGELQGNWEALIGHISRWEIKSRLLTSSTASIAAFVIQMVTIATVVAGVYLIAAQQLSLGGLIAAVMLSSRCLSPAAQLTGLSTRFYQAKSALLALDQLMNQQTEQESSQKPIPVPAEFKAIEFKQVDFTYAKQHTTALTGLNLHIKAGEKVGIIGRIGSGKSTLQRLLMRFYEPDSGSIRINGIDTRQVSSQELRQRIGYIHQDTQLYFGTVWDNIVLGAGHIDEAAVLAAAQLSGVTAITDEHPKGLHMPVAEQGSNLSGGQRQAIALARALINNPDILLFDEPCSAMDSLSEYLFKEKLKGLLENKTLIMSTYKSSMLELVDRIIVIEQGKLVADGPKDEVLAALAKGRLTQ
ncbi:type I secretion system permease/ATPase [Endozoicomonas sp. OPT23]|uniref:type I secretion system permease/ATPase n=1 Tax=Endozoicomonas sp. OPT23 TaxID=2072845 RepID=UPI00129B079C|nr:type I secretion system permease/ATPase [Endozoicomonas sp. OPT23]MRI34816.1 type I secretion system permease/ATPase [Endozoicomonas sp. OPT23]